jgi:hypothetical protein
MGAVAQAGPLFLSNLSLIRLDVLLVVALQLFAAYFKLLHFFSLALKEFKFNERKKINISYYHFLRSFFKN